jgi:hypothetical protein
VRFVLTRWTNLDLRAPKSPDKNPSTGCTCTTLRNNMVRMFKYLLPATPYRSPIVHATGAGAGASTSGKSSYLTPFVTTQV